MTKIEWADETWNPVVGCSVISPGCTNCYAMKMAGTRLVDHPAYAGLTEPSRSGPVWTGEVRLNDAALEKPLRWRKPRRVFVNSMGDLFHENVSEDWIDRVFAVIAECHRHQFIVLTKRAGRMRDYCNEANACGTHWLAGLPWAPPAQWPLPNVILGVSVEDQARADQRIPLLLDTPAALCCVSYEPVLGPVDFCNLTRFERDPAGGAMCDALHEGGFYSLQAGDEDRAEWDWRGTRIDWLIMGGESGPGARPMDADWARSARDQCADAGVAFFFKQWGGSRPGGPALLDGVEHREYPPFPDTCSPSSDPRSRRRARWRRAKILC